jgi:hypothetical protein
MLFDGAELDVGDVLGALDQLVVLLRNDHEGLAFRLEGGEVFGEGLRRDALEVKRHHHDQAFDGFLGETVFIASACAFLF